MKLDLIESRPGLIVRVVEEADACETDHLAIRGMTTPRMSLEGLSC